MLTSAVRIPRGTCRLFGAIKALGTIRKCVILVHGPKGCVYHINYILGMRGDRPSEVYSTCLDEHDVIFGAEEKLKEAVEELDRELHPDMIAVLSCCASSIIGEDVHAAVADANVSCRVVGIDSGGFEGDFRTGYAETLKRLVEELVLPTERTDPKAVNIVGLLRGGPDLRELRSLIESIGIEIRAVLTADTCLAEIEQMASASLNVVVCEPAGLEAARFLEKKFGIPYIVEEIPIGRKQAEHFLIRISESLGMPVPEIRIPGPVSSFELTRSDLRIAIISGPTRAISMTRFLQELGIPPCVVVVDFNADTRDRLAGVADPDCRILIEPEQGEIIQALKEEKVDLLIGGMLERPLAAKLGIKFIDMMHGSQRTVGCLGAQNLSRMIEDIRT
jgi:light-independent protochlorophyllide reductase B subunit